MPPGTTVVARVDGTELHLSDVEAAQQSLPPQVQKMPLAQIYPMLLDRLVDGMLITEAGRKAHLDQDPEVQLRLKRYEDRLIQEAYLNKAIKDAETRGPAQGALREPSSRRRRATKRCTPGTSWSRPRPRRTRSSPSSTREPISPSSPRSIRPTPAANRAAISAISAMTTWSRSSPTPPLPCPPGQYTKTPVKTEFGWHVIKVEDHRVSTPPSFDEARKEVSQLVAHDVVDAKLKELRSAAKVETYGLDGKPLPSSAK